MRVAGSRLSASLGCILLALIAVPSWLFAQEAASASTMHLQVLDVSSMDRTVDPCTDFFQYTCGGWIRNNPIPPDRSMWSVYSKLDDANLGRLRTILEAASLPEPSRNAYTQKIGDYYASCVDEKTIDALGASPLKEPLERIQALKSKGELAEALASLGRQGMMFRFSSSPDYANANQVVADLDQGGLGLPDRDFYFKEDEDSKKLRTAYVAHVAKMFELLGDPATKAAAEAATVMHIETELARGSLTRVDRRSPRNLDHKMTAAQLEKLAPDFAWKTYFTKTGLPSLESLNVETPDFFKALNTQLGKEGLDAWKTYLRWHLVHANARFLSSPFVDENFNFYGKTLQGEQQLQPRWKRCTEYVDDDLGEALGRAYVDRYFSPEAKQQALKMVKQIEAAMEEDIESLSWMTPETKKNALIKLHAIANKIGYPDKWRDYSALDIRRGDVLGNVWRSRQFEFHRQLAKIGKPQDRTEWTMTAPTVNAEYDPQRNDINFPAGILQAPLFDPASDAAPNYGDTGATIGHELTHGFDDEGRQFDAIGNLRDWWTPGDAKQFEERASCISNQYSQYVIVDDIKINGKLTLGEDVADLGGLMLAYMAWQSDTKDRKLESIDGLTPAQRFFVAYGQSWCGSTRDQTKRLLATVDPHSPDKYRTNGVVSNMPQFQQAFQCKTSAPMAPAKRCRVW